MPNSNGKILDRLTTKNVIYVILIGLLCLALCGYDLRWIIPSIAIFSLTVVYTVWMNSKKKSEIANHIKEVNSQLISYKRINRYTLLENEMAKTSTGKIKRYV